MQFVFMILAVLAAAIFIPQAVQRVKHIGRQTAENIAEGTHGGTLNMLADAAQTTRFMLAKFGTDANHVAIMAATSNIPLGPYLDEPSAAEEQTAIALLGVYPGTLKMIAGEAMATVGVELYTGAAGKVTLLSGSAGTYYKIGILLSVAAADGDIIEVQHCIPIVKVVP